MYILKTPEKIEYIDSFCKAKHQRENVGDTFVKKKTCFIFRDYLPDNNDDEWKIWNIS